MHWGSKKTEASRFAGCFSEVMLQVTVAVAMGKLLASLKFSQSFPQLFASLSMFYKYCKNKMLEVQTHYCFLQSLLNINSTLPSYSTL